MKIKVNVYLLNRRPGDILDIHDKDYDIFKPWAERKDRRNGAQICEFHVEQKVVNVSIPAETHPEDDDKKQWKKSHK